MLKYLRSPQLQGSFKKRKMLTIKDVAKQANVSEGTVDRVIHNRGGVSKKTEQKILRILQENNFKLNPIASALALKKKYVIATLVPKFDRENVFWESPHMGIMKALSEVESYGIQIKDHSFDQFDTDSYLSEFERILKTRPDVVILVPMFIEQTKEIANRLDHEGIPYMFLNIDLEGLNNICFIGQDSYMGGYVAGKLMCLSLGKGDGCVTVRTRSNITNYHAIYKRMEGFNRYLESSCENKIVNLDLKVDNLNDTGTVKETLEKFLIDNVHIKGIYVPSSRTSVIAECLDVAFHKRVKIIGFDTTPQNIHCMERDQIQFLISQRSFNQGYEAVRTMSDYLIHRKTPVKRIYSPIQIIMKENLAYNDRNKLSFQSENAKVG